MSSGKTREKMLERELARLAGENWQSNLNLDLPHNSSAVSLSLKAPQRSAGSTSQDSSADSVVTAEMLEKVKLLVMGMERRLEIRKEKLTTAMAEAKTEAQKYDDLTRALQTQ